MISPYGGGTPTGEGGQNYASEQARRVFLSPPWSFFLEAGQRSEHYKKKEVGGKVGEIAPNLYDR